MIKNIEKIKQFIKIEKDIKGILNTICNIEKTEGINSLKLNSLTELLKDFLNDEKNIVNEIFNDSGYYHFLLNLFYKTKLESLSEIEATFLSDNEIMEYKIFKLLKINYGMNEIDLMNRDLNMELIKITNLEVKYNLCFLNPLVMDSLIQYNFNQEKNHANLNLDDINKINFLIRRCARLIMFMVENDKINDINCLKYLEVVKSFISDDYFEYICGILSKSGYDFDKIYKIFESLNEKTLKKLD